MRTIERTGQFGISGDGSPPLREGLHGEDGSLAKLVTAQDLCWARPQKRENDGSAPNSGFLGRSSSNSLTRELPIFEFQSYLSTRTKQHEGAVFPRQAGAEAGIYDYPEGHFVNVVRVAKPPRKAAAAKAARKSRS